MLRTLVVGRWSHLENGSMSWCRSAFAMAGLTCLTACSDDMEKVDPVALAEDVRIHVGEQTFVLPRVAVGGAWRDSKDGFRTRRPNDEIDGFSVLVGVYESTGEDLASREICPRLSRQWARSICQSAYTPLYASLPRKFTILRPGAFEGYRRSFYSGAKETQYDLIQRLHFEAMRPQRACTNPDASRHQFCITGIQLHNGLLALWDSEGDDTRVARMVQSFVEYAMGPRENFETLEREAVLRRNPLVPCLGRDPYDRASMDRVRNYEGVTRCPKEPG
jgi:hypothetical protein